MLVSYTGIELERRAMVETQCLVISSRSSSQRPLLSYTDGVELGAVPSDLSDRITAVCCYAVTVALASVTHSNDSLRVSIPGDVVNPSADNRIFTFCIA